MAEVKGFGADAYAEAYARLGSNGAVAREFGVNESTVRRALNRRKVDPAVQDGMDAIGTKMVPNMMWAKTDANGNTTHSIQLKPDLSLAPEFRDLIRETISEIKTDITSHLPKRFRVDEGNLFVLDPADVHIGKLCVASETGFAYDEAVAEHRLVEGSRMLLERAVRDCVSRVMFIMGNDIGHVDSSSKKTTSGTPQDVSGSWFSNYRVAQRAYVRIIKMCLEMDLDVIPVFNPSNHDWHTGFAIANSVGLLFGKHANVHCSDYNLSEEHRKYLRFGRQLIATDHGDGAREADLPQLAMVEAREYISECPLIYWYRHHYHHKIRKQRGLSDSVLEKDHIAMTAIHSGTPNYEGHNGKIEYVRSPSAPDGWHHRNGYINRQAVEGFVHHPEDGQISRFTEWF